MIGGLGEKSPGRNYIADAATSTVSHVSSGILAGFAAGSAFFLGYASVEV